MKKKSVIWGLFVFFAILGFLFLNKYSGGAVSKIVSTFTDNDFGFDKNTPGYANFAKLAQGCPRKDCIPSIDDPIFESVDAADEWLEEPDTVFVLKTGGEVRAYPQKILNWHEIVNDEIGGNPVAVTFCPLCGSGLAFDRSFEGEILEFGVSGKLHNNDLVMYDRNTNTLWQQITGEALVGKHFGKVLKQISMGTQTWESFKKDNPNAVVLSRETGYSRNYNQYPYGSYETDKSVNFPIEGGVDMTLHPKEVVFGIVVGQEAKAYRQKTLESEKNITDTVGGVSVNISYNNGNVSVRSTKTGDEISVTRLFWFAWKAFRPETTIYE